MTAPLPAKPGACDLWWNPGQHRCCDHAGHTGPTHHCMCGFTWRATRSVACSLERHPACNGVAYDEGLGANVRCGCSCHPSRGTEGSESTG